MERENKIIATHVGRFSPLHQGHQMIIDSMAEKHGIKNCLILVGSSNSYTERTPYTFEERREMIFKVYPNLLVLPLPDTKPQLKYFDGTTNSIWLKSIKKIEEDMGAKFVFYGGSQKDLEVLGTMFETYVLVNRKTEGLNISGTKVREALEKDDMESLKSMIDPKVVGPVIAGYKKFHSQVV